MAKGTRALDRDTYAARIVERLEAGHGLADACRMAGAGRTTVYDWMAEDAGLRGRIDAAREKGRKLRREQCEAVILEAAHGRDGRPGAMAGGCLVPRKELAGSVRAAEQARAGGGGQGSARVPRAFRGSGNMIPGIHLSLPAGCQERAGITGAGYLTPA